MLSGSRVAEIRSRNDVEPYRACLGRSPRWRVR